MSGWPLVVRNAVLRGRVGEHGVRRVRGPVDEQLHSPEQLGEVRAQAVRGHRQYVEHTADRVMRRRGALEQAERPVLVEDQIRERAAGVHCHAQTRSPPTEKSAAPRRPGQPSRGDRPNGRRSTMAAVGPGAGLAPNVQLDRGECGNVEPQ